MIVFLLKQKGIKRMLTQNILNLIEKDYVTWISYKNMTHQELDNNPGARLNNGYIKVLCYKEKFKNSVKKATLHELKALLLLPDFDEKVFKNIHGIDLPKMINQKTKIKDRILIQRPRVNNLNINHL